MAPIRGGGNKLQLPDENSIIDVLNENWATVTQIRSRIGSAARSVRFAEILERMAIAGKIDRTFEKTVAAKRNSKPLFLSFYRRHPGDVAKAAATGPIGSET